MEVEFTYGVKMSLPEAEKVGETAKENKIHLSIHCPYYINLASKEPQKRGASRKRILDSCERGHLFSWDEKTPIVFHAGFYQGADAEEIFKIIKEQIDKIQEDIDAKKWNVILCPETTGKKSQFGSLDELLRLMKETKCGICVDFAHLKARENGKIDYSEVMKKLKGLKHVHAHFSGIEYTEKGERRHLITETKDIKELIDLLKKYDIDVTIINESPDPVGDSLKTKKILEK
jgi:deoxyribonuclease IV